MRVCRVARDIADDGELARGRCEGLRVDEGWNLGGQVDAVDEDVGLDDLLVRAWLGFGLWKIPFLVALAWVESMER